MGFILFVLVKQETKKKIKKSQMEHPGDKNDKRRTLSTLSSVLHDAQVAGDDLVLKLGSHGDVNAFAVVCNDNHRALK